MSVGRLVSQKGAESKSNFEGAAAEGRKKSKTGQSLSEDFSAVPLCPAGVVCPASAVWKVEKTSSHLDFYGDGSVIEVGIWRFYGKTFRVLFDDDEGLPGG